LKFIKLISISFSLPSAKITNPDVTRLINSDEIQSVVRPAGRKVQKRPWTQKKNALVNRGILFRLNPYAKTQIRHQLRTQFMLSFVVFLFIIFFQSISSALRSRLPRGPRHRKLLEKNSLTISLLLEIIFVDFQLCTCNVDNVLSEQFSGFRV